MTKWSHYSKHDVSLKRYCPKCKKNTIHIRMMGWGECKECGYIRKWW